MKLIRIVNSEVLYYSGIKNQILTSRIGTGRFSLCCKRTLGLDKLKILFLGLCYSFIYLLAATYFIRSKPIPVSARGLLTHTQDLLFFMEFNLQRVTNAFS